MAMVFELRAETGNARGSIARVGHRLGINTETLRNWVQKAEVDSGQRPGTTSDDKKRIAELEREVRELRRANEILKAASAYFARELDPRLSALVGFIDSHKGRFGVEPACAVLGISPSTYYAAKKREENPSARDIRDEELKKEIIRVREKRGRKLYGAKKIWHELDRDGIEVARCTVERLMSEMGIAGARSRRKRPRTTMPGPAGQERPSDLVGRDFTAPAPNRRWVADITYVETAAGFVYAAFILDLFSRMITGWQVSDNLRAGARSSATGRGAGYEHHRIDRSLAVWRSQ